MRNQISSYNIVPVLNGSVIEFVRGNKREYLGSDGLWHRTAKACDPFLNEGDCYSVITREREGETNRA
jgi:hypothetical protein